MRLNESQAATDPSSLWKCEGNSPTFLNIQLQENKRFQHLQPIISLKSIRESGNVAPWNGAKLKNQHWTCVTFNLSDHRRYSGMDFTSRQLQQDVTICANVNEDSAHFCFLPVTTWRFDDVINTGASIDHRFVCISIYVIDIGQCKEERCVDELLLINIQWWL